MKANVSRCLIKLPVMVAFSCALAGTASAQQAVQLSGAPCATPPVLHCPDADVRAIA
jgi:hypothetical protein